MRPAIAASALCLSLLLLAAIRATPQTPASPAATPSTPPTAVQTANDLAAKHAKRTACLKEARTRKLIGADKTSFLKSCMEDSPDAVSASRVDKP